MLSFLLSLNKKHNRYLSTIILSTFAICIGIWGFEVQNLFPSGTLASTEKWQIRIFLTLLTIVGSLLSSLILTLVFYKKTIDDPEAEMKKNTFIKVNMDVFKNPAATPATQAVPVIKTADTIENNKSPKSDFDEVFKRLLELSKPK